MQTRRHAGFGVVAFSREQPFHALPRLLRSRQRVLRRSVRADLEHQRPVVADFLDRGQRRRPVDRALEGHQMIVGAAAVVVHVRRDRDAPTPSRSRRRGRRPCARGRSRGRCRRRRLRASSSTKCTSDPARDSSFGITSTAIRTPSGSATCAAVPRCCAAPRRGRPAPALSPVDGRPAPPVRGRPRGARPAPSPGSAARCAARCSASTTACARASASLLARLSGPTHRPPSYAFMTGA